MVSKHSLGRRQVTYYPRQKIHAPDPPKVEEKKDDEIIDMNNTHYEPFEPQNPGDI